MLLSMIAEAVTNGVPPGLVIGGGGIAAGGAATAACCREAARRQAAAAEVVREIAKEAPHIVHFAHEGAKPPRNILQERGK